MPNAKLTLPRCLSALLLALMVFPAQAATLLCVTQAMRSNKWICTDDPTVCSFVFAIDDKRKTLFRNIDERNPRVPIVIDKWDENVIIAHEDQTRVDARFIEQYFYKIELDTGKFLMANEYMTNHGRYLSQEELNLSEKKRFSYYRPKLFSEKGRCRLKR
jgi:hypothetical protein